MGRPWRRAALDDPSERFVELRIVDRQNRAAAQLPDEAAEPDRAERQRQHDVEPADDDAVLVELRRDQPEQIDQPRPAARRRRPSAAARAARLTCRDSSRTNGTTKCEHDQRDADRTASRVCSRCRYQAISSGRLPDQMIRYCENEK